MGSGAARKLQDRCSFADAVGVWPTPASDHGSTLYQDARWLRIGRLQYGFVAYPLFVLGLYGSISTGVLWHVGLALGLFGLPILICERRITRMGFRITDTTIDIIRPLNRTRIRWDEIDRFDLLNTPGLVDYGHRRVGIKRRRHGVVPRSRMVIPTLWITVPTRFWLLRGPNALKTSTGERIPDVLGFLNEQLAAHTGTAMKTQAA